MRFIRVGKAIINCDAIHSINLSGKKVIINCGSLSLETYDFEDEASAIRLYNQLFEVIEAKEVKE